jgi:aminoglycoside phosphotransferase (APT) family kinase protein
VRARSPLRRASAARSAPIRLNPEPELGEALERIAGARPLRWRSVGGGHTRASRWRVGLADGGSVFVKVPRDERSLHDFERELRVYENVRGAFLPAFVGASRGGPAMLVLEDLGGARWPPPWPDDVSDLFAALEAIAGTPAPRQLPRLPAERATYWERIARDPECVVALGACSPAWLEHALPALIEAESRLDPSGDALVHFDVWSANVCFARRGAVLVDWGAASIGNRWFDVAFALLALRTDGVAPPAIDFPDEAAFAAYLAGHDAWSASSPPASGLVDFETLRAGWLQDLGAALPWAAGQLGLPPPR